MKKQNEKKLQVVELNKDKHNTHPYGIKLPSRKNFKPKDVLRIQSQLIRGFVSGKIDDQSAKTLSYLCNNYIQNLQLVEFEERIQKLEEHVDDEAK